MTSYFDFVLLIIFCCIAIYISFKNAFSYWSNRCIPSMPPSIPFGNLKDIIFERNCFGTAVAEKHEYFKQNGYRFGGFYLFTMPVMILTDPDLVRNVLTNAFGCFNTRGFIANEDVDPMSCNLFVLSGSQWKNLRNVLSPTFSSGKMKKLFPVLLEKGHVLHEYLSTLSSTNEAIDIRDILSKYSTDVIGSCVFGLELDSFKNPDSEFRRYGHFFVNKSLSSNIKAVFGMLLPSVMIASKTPFVNIEVRQFFFKILRDTISYRELNNVKCEDFIDMFIKLKNKDSIEEDKPGQKTEHALSFNEMAAQAFLFFVAGFETLSTTMGYCLFELACNPELQDRLRAELKHCYEKDGRVMLYESVMKMEYLDMVVSEILRMYPVVPVINRMCTRKYTIPGTNLIVEPGTMTWVSILGMHWDPEFYPDPQQFDPERFSEASKSKRTPCTYLPFGDGPKNCIGMRFALLQVKLGLAVLLRNFQFTVHPKMKGPAGIATSGILVRPKNTILLNAIKVTD